MKIAVWYHGLLSGPRLPDPDWVRLVFAEQMSALGRSGLAARADELHVCLNGPDGDALLAAELLPEGALLEMNGPDAQTELATLGRLRSWLRPGWLVLYHHLKGAQYPNQAVWNNWRRCMEFQCVWNWERCLRILGAGYDTVGAHWMDNATYPMVPPGQRYWGGNFWWAKSDYLLTLPPLSPDRHDLRYDAEVWIGQSPTPPRYKDLARHFPMRCPARNL